MVEGYSAAPPAQSAPDDGAALARAAAVVPVRVYPSLSAANYRSIFHAADVGDMKAVQGFINGDPTCIHGAGTTVLHFAAESGNLDLVRYLVEGLRENQRLDPRAVDHYGITVLHMAAKSGNLDLVRYLVEQHRANPKAFIKYYRDSLCWEANDNFHILAYFADLGLEIPIEDRPQVNLIRQRARKALEDRQIRGLIGRQPFFKGREGRSELSHCAPQLWLSVANYTGPVGVSAADIANNRYIFPYDVDMWNDMSDELRSSIKARIRGVQSEEYLLYKLEKNRLEELERLPDKSWLSSGL